MSGYPTIRLLLEQKGRGESIPPDEAAEWLLDHNPKVAQALKQGDLRSALKIWRGSYTEVGSIRLVSPDRHSGRRAANTFDMYRAFVDAANPDWPQRSHSIVATTCQYKAGDYGSVHAVIPAAGARIANAYKPDFWETGVMTVNYVIDMFRWVCEDNVRQQLTRSEHGITDVEGWNKYAKELRRGVQQYIQEAVDREEIEVKYVHNRLRQKALNASRYASLNELATDIANWMLNASDNDAFFDVCKPHLKYESLGMRLTTYEKGVGLDNEVWIDSPCLIVEFDSIPLVAKHLGGNLPSDWADHLFPD